MVAEVTTLRAPTDGPRVPVPAAAPLLAACLLAACPARPARPTPAEDVAAATGRPAARSGDARAPVEDGGAAPRAAAEVPRRDAGVADSRDADGPGAAPLACEPSDLSSRPLASLRRMAKSDPCAMRALADRLLAGPTRPEQYREAAELSKLAHDAGVAFVRCELFHYGIGMAPDLGRAAECYRRAGSLEQLALLYVNGEGVPRDLDRAEALAVELATPHGGSIGPTCTPEGLRRIVDVERLGPSRAPYDYCEDVACSTWDEGYCVSLADLRKSAPAAETREAGVAGLDPSARASLTRLEKALAVLADAEAEQVYVEHIDGTARAALSLARAAAVRDAYHRTFEKVVVARSAPAVTEPEFEELRAAVAKALAEDTGAGTDGRPAPPALRKAARATDRAWGRYRDAWVALGAPLLASPRPEAERSVEALLLRERLALLEETRER